MSRTTNEEQKMNHKNASEMRKKNVIKAAALTTGRTSKKTIRWEKKNRANEEPIRTEE